MFSGRVNLHPDQVNPFPFLISSDSGMPGTATPRFSHAVYPEIPAVFLPLGVSSSIIKQDVQII
jgi:hypothetical protein